MFRQPITLSNLSFVLPHKTCFEDFSTQIYYGDRIAIIGNNGSGKSTLLEIIQEIKQPTYGSIHKPSNIVFGYVPQQILITEPLSGGQQFQSALTQALSKNPNVLLLDEPTNNLDVKNRKSLLHMLQSYRGTLIIVSHDVTLLRSYVNILWHIDNGIIYKFIGAYDNYIQKISIQKSVLEHEIAILNRAKKETHKALMTEQERAKKNNSYGKKQRKQSRWSPIAAGAKERQAQITANRNNKHINEKKHILIEQLSHLHIPEIITPTFTLPSNGEHSKIIVAINDASIGYTNPIVTNITLSINGSEHVALRGDNGSGKTTFLKALLSDSSVIKTGSWHTPSRKSIGYLDQHYATLDQNASIFEMVQQAVPNWTNADIRKHLNNFLFRKNEEVVKPSKTFSGGERVRAVLALIAAKPPQLLVLDEITNNLDIITRKHVIQTLKNYPSAMIVVSHDEDFLENISITTQYTIDRGVLQKENSGVRVYGK